MCRPLLMLGFLFFLFTKTTSNVFAVSCTSADLSDSHIIRGLPAEVVANNSIVVYSEPSTNAEIVTQLTRQTRLSIASEAECGEQGIWWQIRFQDDHQTEVDRGYVLESNQGTPQIASLIQHLNMPSGSTVITESNLEQLQPIVSAEYEWPLDLVWSPNNAYLAISTPWAIWIHSLNETDKTPFSLTPTANETWNRRGSMRFSSDSETIGTVGLEGDLLLWKLTDMTHETIDIVGDDYAGVAAISPNLRQWAIANWDGSISLWDAQTGKEKRLLGHILIGSLAFTPDGSILVSDGGTTRASIGNEDNTLRLWDVETGDNLATFDTHPLPGGYGGTMSDISITNDGLMAAVFSLQETQNSGVNGVIHLIDIPSRSMKSEIQVSGEGSIKGIAFNFDGSILAVNFSSSLIFLDLINEIQLQELTFTELGLIHDIAFSSDGRFFTVSYENGDYIGSSNVEIWAVP